MGEAGDLVSTELLFDTGNRSCIADGPTCCGSEHNVARRHELNYLRAPPKERELQVRCRLVLCSCNSVPTGEPSGPAGEGWSAYMRIVLRLVLEMGEALPLAPM